MRIVIDNDNYRWRVSREESKLVFGAFLFLSSELPEDYLADYVGMNKEEAGFLVDDLSWGGLEARRGRLLKELVRGGGLARETRQLTYLAEKTPRDKWELLGEIADRRVEAIEQRRDDEDIVLEIVGRSILEDLTGAVDDVGSEVSLEALVPKGINFSPWLRFVSGEFLIERGSASASIDLESLSRELDPMAHVLVQARIADILRKIRSRLRVGWNPVRVASPVEGRYEWELSRDQHCAIRAHVAMIVEMMSDVSFEDFIRISKNSARSFISDIDSWSFLAPRVELAFRIQKTESFLARLEEERSLWRRAQLPEAMAQLRRLAVERCHAIEMEDVASDVSAQLISDVLIENVEGRPVPARWHASTQDWLLDRVAADGSVDMGFVIADHYTRKGDPRAEIRLCWIVENTHRKNLAIAARSILRAAAGAGRGPAVT